jgi:four helix bundle protein
VQDFRKLRVWKKAHALASDIRDAGDGFPRNRFASLRNQMIRAAESVVFNIAEGCGAASQKEFARFLEISSKSSMELESQLELAQRYGLIHVSQCDGYCLRTSTIRRMLWGLRQKVLCDRRTTDNGKRTTDDAL